MGPAAMRGRRRVHSITRRCRSWMGQWSPLQARSNPRTLAVPTCASRRCATLGSLPPPRPAGKSSCTMEPPLPPPQGAKTMLSSPRSPHVTDESLNSKLRCRVAGALRQTQARRRRVRRRVLVAHPGRSKRTSFQRGLARSPTTSRRHCSFLRALGRPPAKDAAAIPRRGGSSHICAVRHLRCLAARRKHCPEADGSWPRRAMKQRKRGQLFKGGLSLRAAAPRPRRTTGQASRRRLLYFAASCRGVGHGAFWVRLGGATAPRAVEVGASIPRCCLER
mmetsp:Transcript_66384/g.184957  ORF Transcript_66384/g.184957 Transcript_66384/m.184957 type:complete len:278 (-) Transcript_66384:119-952(-)